MKQYSANVYLNGEFYCGIDSDSLTDALASATDHARQLQKRRAKISKALKIRDRSDVEVRGYCKTLGR